MVVISFDLKISFHRLTSFHALSLVVDFSFDFESLEIDAIRHPSLSIVLASEI